MAVGDYITTENGRPSIRWTAVATTIFGTVAYGFIVGVVELINSGRRVVLNILDGLADFGFALPYLLLDGAASAAREAWATNGEFLQVFGPAAFVVGMFQLVIVTYLLVTGLDKFISGVT